MVNASCKLTLDPEKKESNQVRSRNEIAWKRCVYPDCCLTDLLMTRNFQKRTKKKFTNITYEIALADCSFQWLLDTCTLFRYRLVLHFQPYFQFSQSIFFSSFFVFLSLFSSVNSHFCTERELKLEKKNLFKNGQWKLT